LNSPELIDLGLVDNALVLCNWQLGNTHNLSLVWAACNYSYHKQKYKTKSWTGNLALHAHTFRNWMGWVLGWDEANLIYYYNFFVGQLSSKLPHKQIKCNKTQPINYQKSPHTHTQSHTPTRRHTTKNNRKEHKNCVIIINLVRNFVEKLPRGFLWVSLAMGIFGFLWYILWVFIVITYKFVCVYKFYEFSPFHEV